VARAHGNRPEYLAAPRRASLRAGSFHPARPRVHIALNHMPQPRPRLDFPLLPSHFRLPSFPSAQSAACLSCFSLLRPVFSSLCPPRSSACTPRTSAYRLPRLTGTRSSNSGTRRCPAPPSPHRC
jgi:hypothetical protein